MNQEQFSGKWKQFKGKIKEQWGELTDDDINKINGNYDQFLGKLEERYGYEKEQAEKEFDNWNWGNEEVLTGNREEERRSNIR